MTISVEELGPGTARGQIEIAVQSSSRRVEGTLSFLLTNPQTPELVAPQKLQPDELAAVDAWLKRRFPRSDFAPTESRRPPGVYDD